MEISRTHHRMFYLVQTMMKIQTELSLSQVLMLQQLLEVCASQLYKVLLLENPSIQREHTLIIDNPEQFTSVANEIGH